MIRMLKVSKLTDHFYPKCLLAFDEFPVKEIDQNIAFPRVQRVLPQLNDRAAEVHLFQLSPVSSVVSSRCPLREQQERRAR